METRFGVANSLRTTWNYCKKAQLRKGSFPKKRVTPRLGMNNLWCFFSRIFAITWKCLLSSPQFDFSSFIWRRWKTIRFQKLSVLQAHQKIGKHQDLSKTKNHIKRFLEERYLILFPTKAKLRSSITLLKLNPYY